MKIRELIIESRQPGEWVYHASHIPSIDKPGGISNWLKSIISRGLRPSGDGYMGPGTYFAYNPDEGYYHVDKEDSMILRAKWHDLVKMYGIYPDNKNGIQRSGDEIVVPGTIPASMLEVEYFPDEWWTLQDALAAETGH